MIIAGDVDFSYGGTPALAGVSLTARAGEVVGLIGPNGSGKTTLLRTLYAALRPSAGLITLDDDPVWTLRPHEMARRAAVVMQEPAVELPMTVTEMVLLGRSPHRSARHAYTRADHVIAADSLRRVGARHLADRVHTSLSGGEKQRVLVARSLAQDTDHLLLDEPTNHLDIRYQHEILALVRGLDAATVVVLHDLNLAARYCDRLVLLDAGHVVATGPPGEVLHPDVLEPVYGIGVRRIVDDGTVQLLFRPHATDP